jgi:UDP-N-acetylglucosamine 2-epimerase (non-hydrolysing)
MKITIVAGARPNIMKVAPIIAAIQQAMKEGKSLSYRLVHTGQHYDKNMSDTFFAQLGVPNPDINLKCGGGTQAEQTANIMIKFEEDLINFPPNLVIVVGDVTSTMACAITAKKLGIDVVHIEAGIRSGDRTMPEEINRLITDAITDVFFTTSETANQHLLNAGINKEKIHFVGNTMIDTLLINEPRFVAPEIWHTENLKPDEYIVITLHRPSNVDGEQHLLQVLNEIMKSANGLPVIFPVHPRTAQKLSALELKYSNLHFTEPLGYLEFNYLVKYAKVVLTDSGGITEETTVLGVPCITLRNSTERPETVTEGTNELIGDNPTQINVYMDKLFAGSWKKGKIPALWDGKTATRIINILLTLYA